MCPCFGAVQDENKTKTMQAARCPTDDLSLTNCAVVSEKGSAVWTTCDCEDYANSQVCVHHKNPPRHSPWHYRFQSATEEMGWSVYWTGGGSGQLQL
ncbi:hypothetical protein J4Q44_G00301150 [Coregonus suidteri]|uniref:Uncharacterized protein n=1 Tax=Coregonus suidteri TaxID=861788 RepID=A0AAN8QSN6_9TELE